jgi:hypothetical protein
VRHLAGDSLLSGVVSNDCVDNEQVRLHLDQLSGDGTWVGEEVILATASLCRRPVHVYSANAKSFPLVYEPPQQFFNGALSPIRLAFQEPGHFLAVTSKRCDGMSDSIQPDVCGGNLGSNLPWRVPDNLVKSTQQRHSGNAIYPV